MGTLLRRVTVAVLLALALLPPPRASLPTHEDAAGASLTVQQGWVHLRVGGAPREMGVQHGTLLRPYLRDLIATSLYPSLAAAGIAARDAQRYASLADASLPAPLREELRGIAEGAGLAYEDVLLWNLRPDLLAWGRDLRYAVEGPPMRFWSRPGEPARGTPDERLAWPAPLADHPAAMEHGGAALALGGTQTAGGEPWVAASLAAPPRGERLLLVQRQPATGQPFVGLALPGEVGLRATLNRAGVALVAVPFATADRSVAGLPTFLLLRQTAAESRTADEALRALHSLPRSGGATLLVADGATVHRVELSARQVRVAPPGDAVPLVAGPPLEGALAQAAALLPQPEGPARGRLAAWLRANGGFVSRAALARLLADPAVHEGRGAASLLWQPGTSVLWLAQAAEGRAAPASGWVEFDLAAWWEE